MSASPMTLAFPNATQKRNRWLVERILLLIAHTAYRYDEQGSELLPPAGPVLLYWNHIHYADPFVLASRMHRRRYSVPVAKRELRDVPIVGKLTDLYGTIFVSRGDADVEALRASLAVLEAGHILLIAPEGTRSKTGSLMHAHRGLGFLARKSGAVLQPLAVWGTPDFPSSNLRGRRPVAHVRYGRPYRVELPDGDDRKAAEAAITDYAMQTLSALLPESLRGVYVPPPRTPSWVHLL